MQGKTASDYHDQPGFSYIIISELMAIMSDVNLTKENICNIR